MFWLPLVLFFSYINSINLDRVILSTNDNPHYYPYWPMVAKAWSKIGVKPTLALIADDSFEIDESLGDVIRFRPIEGIPTWFHAQVIRLFLPLWFEDEVCITSDIDMVPISRAFFLDNIKNIQKDCFVVYRDGAYPSGVNRYPICFFAGKGSTYKEILKNVTKDNVEQTITEWFSWNIGWETDEIVFSCLINKWKEFNKRCVKLGFNSEGMLCRSSWKLSKSKFDKGEYHYAHLLRPYNDYKKDIDDLFFYIMNN